MGENMKFNFMLSIFALALTSANAQVVAALQQRIQDRPGRVSHGKEFAMFLRHQFHAQRCEPVQRRLGIERGQHVLDDVARPVEVGRGHVVVSDVAASAAGDADFCQNVCAFFQQQNFAVSFRFRARDRREESRRASARAPDCSSDPE